MNGDIHPCAPFNIINDLLIRAQEGMQLVVAMILHVLLSVGFDILTNCNLKKVSNGYHCKNFTK